MVMLSLGPGGLVGGLSGLRLSGMKEYELGTTSVLGGGLVMGMN